ncbi:hypothetical protein SDC9_83756 [bioreactor metagenome]|uniref:Uncharacterized protein n=1 Tax=bioreactor metagenome TaxID=1076179 RepID=A0A644Z8D4_9ZZZZ
MRSIDQSLPSISKESSVIACASETRMSPSGLFIAVRTMFSSTASLNAITMLGSNPVSSGTAASSAGSAAGSSAVCPAASSATSAAGSAVFAVQANSESAIRMARRMQIVFFIVTPPYFLLLQRLCAVTFSFSSARRFLRSRH